MTREQAQARASQQLAAQAARNAAMERQRLMEKHTVYRLRRLPEQLERARLRVAQLEREAARLGLKHLIEERP